MNATRTLIVSMALTLAAGLAGGAWAQRPPVRGSLDALTVVPATGAAPQPGGAMPAGHPGMPGTGTGGGGGSGALPSGHPGMPGEGAPSDPTAAMHNGGAMTGAKSGAIRVNVTQGTQGGPALGKDPVTVQLLAKGVAIKSYKTALDEKGVVELRDLPLEVAFQPVITVEHGGAEQQFVGPPMHKLQPMVEMDMKVFETTRLKPEWTLGLWDIDVDAVDAGDGAAGLHFTELLGGFLPGDKAWTGEVVGGQQRTMTVKLPVDALDVQLGPGFAEAGALVIDHAVVRGKTMLPGSAQYVLGYTQAVKDGKVTATFTAPANTSLFALYFPPDVKVESMTGLELSKPGGTNASQNRQLLKAKGIKAGESVSAVFTGIKAPVAATKPEVLPQTSDLHLPVPASQRSETKP